jgi:hypothetical protein
MRPREYSADDPKLRQKLTEVLTAVQMTSLPVHQSNWPVQVPTDNQILTEVRMMIQNFNPELTEDAKIA